MMGTITLDRVKVYAYHGCLAEETMIGSDYLVNLNIEADLSLSAQSDHLEDTVDYVLLRKIITQEMSRPRKLLETVAHSILDHIFLKCTTVNKATVSVSKVNPPIGGDAALVTITMKKERK